MAATYADQLDALCAAQGWTWRVWSEWRYDTFPSFERRLYWSGEVVAETSGALIATVRDLHAGNTPRAAQRRLLRELHDAAREGA